MSEVEIAASTDGPGWRCEVTVRDRASSSHHVVTVRDSTLERLDPGRDDPVRLVDGSFVFLLEREPKESILARFDLEAIGRYFPEYEGEIRRRLEAADRV